MLLFSLTLLTALAVIFSCPPNVYAREECQLDCDSVNHNMTCDYLANFKMKSYSLTEEESSTSIQTFKNEGFTNDAVRATFDSDTGDILITAVHRNGPGLLYVRYIFDTGDYTGVYYAVFPDGRTCYSTIKNVVYTDRFKGVMVYNHPTT